MRAVAQDDSAAIATITLAEVLHVAQTAPPQVLAAHANLVRGQAERQFAEGAWFPSLTGQASAGVDYDNRLVLPSAPRIDSLSVDMRASLLLEWAALDLARHASISGARSAERAQGFGFEAAQRTAAWLASELYLRAGAASELVEDAKVSLERRSHQLQATEALVKAGTRSPVDAARAKIEVLSTQYDVTLRQTEERAAFAALAAALGRPADSLVRPARNTEEFPDVTATAAGAQKLAFERRAEIRAAEATRAARQGNYAAALLARLPTLGISATGSASYLEVRRGQGLDGAQYGGAAGVYLRWQGFDPAVWLRAARTEAELGQAESERRVIVHAIASDAVAAFYAQKRATTEHDQAIAVLAAAQVTREAQEGRYRAGLASLLELLDAEDLEQQARKRRIESQRDRAIASARLAAVCGVLLP